VGPRLLQTRSGPRLARINPKRLQQFLSTACCRLSRAAACCLCIHPQAQPSARDHPSRQLTRCAERFALDRPNKHTITTVVHATLDMLLPQDCCPDLCIPALYTPLSVPTHPSATQPFKQPSTHTTQHPPNLPFRPRVVKFNSVSQLHERIRIDRSRHAVVGWPQLQPVVALSRLLGSADGWPIGGRWQLEAAGC